MKNEKSNNIKLGLFITVATLIFTATIYYIGNQQDLFGKTFMVSSIFKNVNGLQSGNNVRYSGINAGHVDNISIINDSMIQVDLIIQKKYHSFLKKDATASIGTDGLVGNKIVNITPGSGQAPIVDDRDLIKSYTQIETEDMMNTLGKTNENIALLTLNLLEITDNIKQGEGGLAMLLNDQNLAKDLSLTVKNLRQTSQHINKLSDGIRTNLEDVNKGDGLLGYLLKDTTLTFQLNKITADLDTLITSRTRPIMNYLEQSSEDIAISSAAIRDLTAQIDLNQGVAHTIFKDSLVAQNLEETLINLNDGTFKFNETMEALQHNFLVRGFFKKKEKRRKKEAEADAKILRDSLARVGR